MNLQELKQMRVAQKEKRKSHPILYNFYTVFLRDVNETEGWVDSKSTRTARTTTVEHVLAYLIYFNECIAEDSLSSINKCEDPTAE